MWTSAENGKISLKADFPLRKINIGSDRNGPFRTAGPKKVENTSMFYQTGPITCLSEWKSA